jgi:2-oxoglutarate ferredoxin oxidoreductase subunit beta
MDVMNEEKSRVLVTTQRPPQAPATLTDDFTPSGVDVGEHHLCPGCGEPIAMRAILEAIADRNATANTVCVFGIGCYTAFSNNLDLEVLQALHGRAPSLATGAKRMLPDRLVISIQGDGDMVNEGLQEVLHAAARGESITCFMLNNGVFGETGGHMTAATVLGQRTKNTLEGRDAKRHGYPIRMATLLSQIEGAAYVARGAVNSAGNVARTKRMIARALEVQAKDGGFSFVEILTMCPTGWFIETTEAPGYLATHLAATHSVGVLLDKGEEVSPASHSGGSEQ